MTKTSSTNLKAFPMDSDQIRAFAARKGDDFVEIVLRNGRIITGKGLIETYKPRSDKLNLWQINEEERFPEQIDGSEISGLSFVN